MSGTATTTILVRRNDMERKPLPHCHEGEGVLDFTSVLDGKAISGCHVNFIHDDILRPGVSIGVHRHEGNDEEYYCIISGNGTMTLDGERFEVTAGDLTGVFRGGSHGLTNTGSQDLRIPVVSVCSRS